MLSTYIFLSPDWQMNITPYLSQPVLIKCHLGIALSAVDFHHWTTKDMQTQEVFWVTSQNLLWCPFICCLSKISTQYSLALFQSVYQYFHPSIYKLIWGWDFARDLKALQKSNYSSSAISLHSQSWKFCAIQNKVNVVSSIIYKSSCVWLSFRKK